MLKLNKDEIKNILPHREPILMLDEVIEIDINNNFIIAKKKISSDDYFLNGHYPNYKVMPGVLIVEAMAQCGGILAMIERKDQKDLTNKIPLFVKIEDVKFKKEVKENDEILIKAQLIKKRENFYKIYSEVVVLDKIVCEGKLVFCLKEKERD